MRSPHGVVLPQLWGKTITNSLAELDRIWTDDLLGRRADANEVQSFLINRSRALVSAGRAAAFTLGIDARYGAGKTYFLRRLADQVKLNHPAAFIDAWADDTIDAPWAALLLAIDEALEPVAPLIDSSRKADLKKRGVQLITALAKGAARKGASYLVGEEGWEDAVDAIFEKEAEDTISTYRERKKAIANLRSSLTDILSSLQGPVKLPMFVFIDELDRCRPTYSIKFLEEIKHIFDIPGIVFVIALHGDQLTKAVSALYGAEFDAKDYLKRFIEKTYTLTDPSMLALINHHVQSTGTPLDQFRSPGDGSAQSVSSFIAISLNYWGVTPRDALKIIDNLNTVVAVWNSPIPLRLEYLLPLVIMNTENLTQDQLFTRINSDQDYKIQYSNAVRGDGREEIKTIFEKFATNNNIDFNYFPNKE